MNWRHRILATPIVLTRFLTFVKSRTRLTSYSMTCYPTANSFLGGSMKKLGFLLDSRFLSFICFLGLCGVMYGLFHQSRNSPWPAILMIIIMFLMCFVTAFYLDPLARKLGTRLGRGRKDNEPEGSS